ncbi:cysteine synthase A [Iocasia frigidifontis]|uniref:Cysteine synthase n=1 Tax=Iocasia fonsfrigidae TaxID=2682810 RepID=A0A8A7KIZ7_9FIRM|nr:cysteine synthase A [Iocasia fonsfrigidae]QTL99798.1 cysteine synthase A [Iocasia fonsfrigidae]
MRIYNNAVELIGDTPIIKLNKVTGDSSATVLLKLERNNPGGSIKDRICYNMIKTAEEEGRLKKGGTIIEPTSGNTGIGLALIGAVKGYQVILTMPDSMSIERRNLLKAYGAKLVLTPGEKGMKGAIDKARELVAKNSDYFMPGQFENPANPEIHRQTTAREILRDTGGKIDYFIAGVGTGGTLTGTAEVLKNEIPEIKAIAVEPATSAVLSGESAGSHKIQGIGAGFIPAVLNKNIIDRVIKISDDKAIETAQLLASKEGLLLGISSGASAAAALQIAAEVDSNKTILALAPDTGERYLSTGLFN